MYMITIKPPITIICPQKDKAKHNNVHITCYALLWIAYLKSVNVTIVRIQLAKHKGYIITTWYYHFENGYLNYKINPLPTLSTHIYLCYVILWHAFLMTYHKIGLAVFRNEKSQYIYILICSWCWCGAGCRNQFLKTYLTQWIQLFQIYWCGSQGICIHSTNDPVWLE